MDGFLADLRLGLRMLVRTPLLSTVAILTIGLGVGGVTFAFSVMYATLYRGLPVRDSDRLVQVLEARPQDGVEQMLVPLHDFVDLRREQRSFESFEGYFGGTVNLAGNDGPPERFQGGFVTAGLLDMLGVAPALGRTFAPGEDAPGSPALLVLNHRVWMNRFGGDPAVVGRTVRMNGETAEIVGVMPEGFGFPMREDLWTNIRTDPASLERRGGFGLQVAAYLRPGVSVPAANEEVAALARRLEATHPENEGVTATVQPFQDAYTPSEIAMMVSLMMAMVVGVLLVACANVANVLLARAVVREREVAVRSALGADRWRVVRQLLTEAVVLGVVGGIVGIGVAWLSVSLLEASIRDMQRPYWITFDLDAPVLLFTSLVTLAAAVGAGTWPAVRASGAGVGTMLRDESRGSSSLRVSRLTSGLVVAELAVSCGLMIAGGLMVDGFLTLNRLDLGFDVERIMTARVGLFETDYPDAEARSRFYHDALRRLAAEPGVEAAAVTTSLPGTGLGRAPVEVDGETYPQESDRPRVAVAMVSAGFFETLGLTPVEGRGFLLAESERGGEPVAVVSQGFAERHMRGAALGRRVRVGSDTAAAWLRVVGVVSDVHPGIGAFGGGEEGPRAAVYLPLGQADPRFASLAVRTAGPPASVSGAMRRSVAAVDPNLPLYWVRSLREAVDETASFHRIFGGLFGIVAAAALFLSAVGLYGVIDFSVASRLREMGVRMAMGAQGRDLLRMVLGRVAGQLALGVGIGLAIGVGLAVPLAATLYGVQVWDPVVYTAIVGTLALTGFTAALVPALRALRVDPVVALRV